MNAHLEWKPGLQPHAGCWERRAWGAGRRRVTMQSCLGDSPWDKYDCHLLNIQPPFFPADKILALFSVAMCPTKYSCHRILQLGMTKLHSLTVEVELEFCWVSGKDLPPEKRGQRWPIHSYLTPSPTLNGTTMSSGSSHLATKRQRSRDSQETPSNITNRLAQSHSGLLLDVMMLREENHNLFKSLYVVSYLQLKALLTYNFLAFLWQERECWKPIWENRVSSWAWIICRNSSHWLPLIMQHQHTNPWAEQLIIIADVN